MPKNKKNVNTEMDLLSLEAVKEYADLHYKHYGERLSIEEATVKAQLFFDGIKDVILKIQRVPNSNWRGLNG